MITKQPTTMTPARKKISNIALKNIISDIVDAPATEWQSDKIIALTDSDNCELKIAHQKHNAHLLRMYGMSLYCEACKKYDVKPTDCVGKAIDNVKFNRWLNRAHKLTYCEHFREYFYKPFMYKIIELTKFI